MSGFFFFKDKCMFNLHGCVQRVCAGGLPCRSRWTWKASSVAAAYMSRQTRWQIVPAAWEPPQASCSSTWKKKKKQGNKECHCDCAARSYCCLVISLIWSFQRGTYGQSHTWWWQTRFLVTISVGLFCSLTLIFCFLFFFFNLDFVIK